MPKISAKFQRCTSMLMTVGYTAPVGLMPLTHRLLFYALSSPSNSTPTRRGWCGALQNFPAVRCPSLVRLFFLSAPFETWECLSTMNYPRSENRVTLLRCAPPTSSPSSIRHRWLLPFASARALKTRLLQLCPGRASSLSTVAPPVSS